MLNIPPFELIYDEQQQEMQKNNDAIADIIVRLRTDKDFFELTKSLHVLEPGKFKSVKELLDAFLK